MADPSTDTWHETMGLSAAKQLRETQTALSASQQDLTAMQDERDQFRANYLRDAARVDQLDGDLVDMELNLADARAEAVHWRATANQHLTHLGDVARALATARYQNRILTAENEAALRRLNEAAEQAEKLRGYWQECSRHRDQILADRAQCPIPEEKP